jgi:SAM-dependent methyltransferase
LLDVATGPGFAAHGASERGADVVGVDLADAMVAEARLRYPGLEFRTGAAEDLPFEPGSFDVVVSSFGLPHFADHSAAFAEFRRVLRPHGGLVMSTWAPPDRNPFMDLAFGGVARCGDIAAGDLPPGESPFAYADPERCATDLQRAGFTDVAVNDVELTFTIDGAVGMMRFLAEVGSRSKALFDAQSDAAKQSIRAFVGDRIAAYAGPDGTCRVPAVAVIVAASAAG